MRMFNVFRDTEKKWSAWLGQGRVAPSQTRLMSIRQSVGDRVHWRLNVDGLERKISCQHEQWCQWLTPLLPVTAFSELPLEIQRLAELYGLQALADELYPQHEVTSHFVEGEVAAEGLFPVLTLIDGERRLDIQFIDWPVENLVAYTEGWEPAVPTAEGSVSLRLELCFGFFNIPLSEWQALRAGDGVIIDNSMDVVSHVYTLCLQQQEIARVRATTDLTWEVMTVGSYKQNVVSEEQKDIGDINLCVTLQVGEMHVNVNELVLMQAGSVLNADLLVDNQVKLLCGGSSIGNGTLIKSEDRWFVRINKINT